MNCARQHPCPGDTSVQGAWGPHHPSPKVLVFPGEIQVFLEVRATEAVPVAADIFHENSWISGSALPCAVRPPRAVLCRPRLGCSLRLDLLPAPSLTSVGLASPLPAPVQRVAVGGRFLQQKRGAAGRGGGNRAPSGSQNVTRGGWRVENQNTEGVLEGRGKKIERNGNEIADIARERSSTEGL